MGRVIGIDIDKSDNLFVHFDRKGVYKWLDRSQSLPSGWLEELRTIQPSFDGEIGAWMEVGTALFLKAVEIGDLRSAQLLFKKDRSIADAPRIADGITALHVACMAGQKELVQWLLDYVKMDVEKADRDGFRPIHHAAQQ